MGLSFAALAIFAWGVGDFLIQRSARKLGDWEALFFITLFAAIVLYPFVYSSLALYSAFEWLVLVLTSFVIFVAGLLDFDALRVGKISAVEPIYALEVPITLALTTFVLGERVTALQFALILILLAGIFLVSNKHLGSVRFKSLERGVWTAFFATIGMGVSNFLFGFGARATDPLMINWFTSAFMAASCFIYLAYVGELHKLLVHLRHNKTLIISVSIADNLAWVAYSTSVLYMPIGIAIGLSESYIALAAVLGLAINKERLRVHQKAGILIVVGAAMALAYTIGDA
ncbi:MAG: DMT family transporter [Candidatus Kaiserbacteria bacterium]|nr:DMT family transporter [Candidatus Kaiserbacteria bacterium]